LGPGRREKRPTSYTSARRERGHGPSRWALIEEDLGAEVGAGGLHGRDGHVPCAGPGDQSQYSAPLRLQAAATPSVRELVAWAAGASREPNLSVLRSPNASVKERAAHLTRVFRKELGNRSRAGAIEQLRLEAARRALQQSAAGLDEVAARCGFGSAEVVATRLPSRPAARERPPHLFAVAPFSGGQGARLVRRRIHPAFMVAGAVFVVLLCAAAVRANPVDPDRAARARVRLEPSAPLLVVSLNLVLYGLVGPFRRRA